MHDESIKSLRHRLKGPRSRRSLKWLPLMTAGAYFLAAVLWILLSDRLLAAFFSDSAILTQLQTVKDLLFTTTTACLLYWVLRRSLRTIQQTQTNLERSEERLQQILQSMPVMLSALDDQSRMIVWNQECERVTGFSAADMIGNPQALTLLYPNTAYRQQMVEQWTNRGNDYRDWEWEITCRDGSVKTVAWSNIADRFPISGWQSWGIGVDVTDRKHSEASLRQRNQELALLHQLSEIILNQQSLNAALQVIVKEISAATAFPIVAIERYDSARQVMVFEGTEGIPLPPDGKPIEVPVSQTSSGMVAQTGQMLVKTYDPSEAKQCDANETLSQLGLKTFVCIPMIVNGKTIGTLSLAHPDAVETKPEFLQWLTSLANYLALLTDRQQTEVALRENEEFFKLVLDFTHIGSWDWRVLTNQVIWNDNHARLLGLVPGEVQASYQAWRDRVHPDDINRVEQAVNQALATQTNFEAEYRVLHPDGSLHWVIGRGRGLYSEAGQVTRMIGVVLDITDRKQTEQQIYALNQTLEQQNLELEALVEQRTAELMTFINTLPDYIFVVERDTMRMPFCNDLIAALVGKENRQQVAGKTIFECYTPELAATFAAQNQRVFETGEALHFQETYTTPLGTMNFDTYKIPLKRPNGEVYALIGTSRDITELVEARQALVDRTAQLEAANQELESFSYSVSHDLRAPLRHLTGFVAALSDRLTQNGQLTDPKVAHYLQILQTSSQTMGQLIDGLLTLSRVGRRQKALAPIDLNPLVAEVLAQRSETNEAEPSAEESSETPIQFRVGELPTVLGDATLLQQVFANLIDNAVKFSSAPKTSAQQNHQPIEIEIGALSDGTIFVRDQGVGFQMEYADQLFGAFQRLHSRSEFEGHGIGLAIVQRIIHRHGGKIWAESKLNQGATFYFKLNVPFPDSKQSTYSLDQELKSL